MVQTASGVYHYTYQDFNNNLQYNLVGTSSGTFGVRYEYNTLDQVTKISEDYGLTQDNTFSGPMGGMMGMYTIARKTMGISYDANGNIATKTYENGSKTAYIYDEFDRVVSTTQYGSGYASGATSTGITTTYAYDTNGNIAAKTNPNGFSVRYEYDGYSRPIKIYDSPTSYLQLSYDKKGNVLDEKRYASPSGVLLYQKQTSYNELGQALQQSAYYINADGSVDNSKTITVSYAYDNSGKVISTGK